MPTSFQWTVKKVVVSWCHWRYSRSLWYSTTRFFPTSWYSLSIRPLCQYYIEYWSRMPSITLAWPGRVFFDSWVWNWKEILRNLITFWQRSSSRASDKCSSYFDPTDIIPHITHAWFYNLSFMIWYEGSHLSAMDKMRQIIDTSLFHSAAYLFNLRKW